MHFHSFVIAAISLASLSAVSAEPLEQGYHRIPKRSHNARLFGRSNGKVVDEHQGWKRSMGPAWSKAPGLKTSKVSAGVGAMQLTVVDSQTVLIIDKAEKNPIQVSSHPAWMEWLNVYTGKYQALNPQTNSFCAGGTFLSNGTMISVGGNPRVNAASYYDANGLTGVRLFPKCDNSGCTLFENPATVRLASARWYPGTVRLQDGSAMILGGMTEGGFNNAAATDNPTFEYYPPKVFGANSGLPVHSPFLHNALNSNLFPITILLPGGNVFVAANTRAMIYNWQTQQETQLPDFPNGVRVTYPWSAASALLPMTIANNWTPSVLFCGGSTVNDATNPNQLSSKTPASKQCVRMDLTSSGMKAWVKEADLPEARTMGETVLTPDGKVVILNGAQTGMAGYANVKDPVGQSNADHPAYRGVIYDPLLASGKRLSTLMPTSKTPRMYHSVATLMPDGSILIAGSNPNADVSKITYKTEYSMEFLSPPYMSGSRPTFSGTPGNVNYGATFTLKLGNVAAGASISVVLMDLGYHTHAVAVDQRLVELQTSGSSASLTVTGPKDATYFPPGYGWVYVVVNGVPSQGQKVMVGSGASPPSSAAAISNMMKVSGGKNGKAFWYSQ